jgi:hypothetical protein
MALFHSNSPNSHKLNMVSSPRLRSRGYPSSSAAVSEKSSVVVSEKSSTFQHKEIFTVLFDPPSFLMTYSIVCHLWKKSKVEKKFSPLPPLRKPPQDSTVLSTEAVSFNFGSFNSEIVPIKPIKSVIPAIEGCSIKIGEISCVLNDPVSASSVLNASDFSNSFDFLFESVANSTKIVTEDQEPQSFRDPSVVFSFAIANQFSGDNFFKVLINLFMKFVNILRIVISAPPWFAGGDGYSPLIFDPGGVTVVHGSINLIRTLTVFNRSQFIVSVFDTGQFIFCYWWKSVWFVLLCSVQKHFSEAIGITHQKRLSEAIRNHSSEVFVRSYWNHSSEASFRSCYSSEALIQKLFSLIQKLFFHQKLFRFRSCILQKQV